MTLAKGFTPAVALAAAPRMIPFTGVGEEIVTGIAGMMTWRARAAIRRKLPADDLAAR